MTEAVILLGHGSRLAEANRGLEEVAGQLSTLRQGARVEVAFLQMAEPTLEDAAARCVGGGAERVLILPFFLFPGAHVLHDIPAAVQGLRRTYPRVEFLLAPHLGAHPKLAEIAAERLEEAMP